MMHFNLTVYLSKISTVLHCYKMFKHAVSSLDININTDEILVRKSYTDYHLHFIIIINIILFGVI